MCKYSDDTGYKCPHESLEDNDYCIFHLQDDNKDVDEFNKGIKEILETEEDSINLNGFYFPSDTDFSYKHFRKEVIFAKVIFSGDTDFSDAIFSGKANFSDAIFSGKAGFFSATFSGDTDFNRALFSGDADFDEAKFSGDTGFGEAKFSGKANFNNAIFLGKAGFFLDVFFGEANFIEAIFSGNAYFRGATFLEEAGFNSAKFSGKADFFFAIFLGEADFFSAKFSGKADFNNAIFSGEANFSCAELSGKFVFIFNKSETIIFKGTYFSDNVRIKADVSKCSFANSNIERVDMTDSIWMRDDDKPKNSVSAFIKKVKNKVGLPDTSIIIWEEQQGELKDNWKELEGIYRRLKQSYQKYGDNSTAGKLYYQEMECKRKQLKGIEKHFWYLFYKSLCGYGERPFRVIWASGLIIFASSLLFFYLGIELLGSEVLDVPPRLIDYNLSLNFMWAIRNSDLVIRDWLECLYTSVITFTTLGYGDVHPIGFSRIVASVEAGFGIIMTALFIFVFSRKMLR